MNSNIKNVSGNELSSLVDRLKNEDSNYARISRAIQIVYWVFVPVYLFLGIRHYVDSGDVSHLLGNGFMVLAFLIFALFFGKYYREYKYVDYSQPTLVMLKKAAYRYKPFQGRMVWITAALILVDIGLTINQEEVDLMIEVQFVFFGAVFLGLLVGLLIWYIKYKPLRDDAMRLIAEIEGD